MIGNFFSRPDNGSIILIGTFAGYNDCDIHVYPSSKGNVYQVAICLKPEKTWNMLYSEYSKLKEREFGIRSLCDKPAFVNDVNIHGRFLGQEVVRNDCTQ